MYQRVATTFRVITDLRCYDRVSSCRYDDFPEEEYAEWLNTIPDDLKPQREQVYYSMDANLYFHFIFPSDQSAAIFRLRWK